MPGAARDLLRRRGLLIDGGCDLSRRAMVAWGRDRVGSYSCRDRFYTGAAGITMRTATAASPHARCVVGIIDIELSGCRGALTVT